MHQSGHSIVRYSVGNCSLGSLVVAASERGVCAIFLGDHPDALVRELLDRFAPAALIRDDAALAHSIARVVEVVESPASALGLPLDERGTPFQRRVWRALRAIPAGTTASYGDIAAQIGAPGAVRAVAGACAANPIAVATPCHRVVRADGALSGYHWGASRKRALIEREAAA
jgi:AraC family transcriptional regulator of adaptative response/methylated-DNA-[protein]-cysteine methyltransferase